VARPWSRWYQSKRDGDISSSPEGRCSKRVISQRDGRSYLACLSPVFMSTLKGKRTGITHRAWVGFSARKFVFTNTYTAAVWSEQVLCSLYQPQREASLAESLNAWRWGTSMPSLRAVVLTMAAPGQVDTNLEAARNCDHVTKSTKLSTTREAAGCATTQELPSILWNPKVLYLFHKNHSIVPILSQTKPIHTTASYLSKIYPPAYVLVFLAVFSFRISN
jgi:hypothetical protein